LFIWGDWTRLKIRVDRQWSYPLATRNNRPHSLGAGKLDEADAVARKVASCSFRFRRRWQVLL
jgi:hypothetical protein